MVHMESFACHHGLAISILVDMVALVYAACPKANGSCGCGGWRLPRHRVSQGRTAELGTVLALHTRCSVRSPASGVRNNSSEVSCPFVS